MTIEPRRVYLRPLPCAPTRPNARPLAGGLFGYAEVEILRRGQAPEILPVDAAETLHPEELETLALLSRPRPALAGLDLAQPRITCSTKSIWLARSRFSDKSLWFS